MFSKYLPFLYKEIKGSMMTKEFPKRFFVASTGQDIGKTTLSLGLLAGFKKRGFDTTYMKPIGQEQETVEGGILVDKDVALIKDYFSLKEPHEHMSPVLIPPGFTKDFLDGEIHTEDLRNKIDTSFEKLLKTQKSLIVEGTGHVGVGSIIKLNNAEVAKRLNLPILLLASGGLGSAFDELSLNKALCDLHQAKIFGVVLNRVKPEKREMVIHYMTKALKRWDIPLVGCLPLDPLLANPSLQDFEEAFECELLSGKEFRLRHFKQIRLAASSVEVFRETVERGQLIITPAGREDIILATLAKHFEMSGLDQKTHPDIGMILTGGLPPRHFVISELQKAHIPVLYTPISNDKAWELIGSFSAKIKKEDLAKITEAIDIVDKHINFDLLLK